MEFLKSPPGNHLEALKGDRTGRWASTPGLDIPGAQAQAEAGILSIRQPGARQRSQWRTVHVARSLPPAVPLDGATSELWQWMPWAFHSPCRGPPVQSPRASQPQRAAPDEADPAETPVPPILTMSAKRLVPSGRGKEQNER